MKQHRTIRDVELDRRTFDELVRDGDTRFPTTPDVGDPDCICSRCGEPIGAGSAIRIWPDDDPGMEIRYHVACLDMNMHLEPPHESHEDRMG